MQSIRHPAVAGLFYPAEPDLLALKVQSMLADIQFPELTPKALIAPHAGYTYSGPVAAAAYATLQKHASTIRRVVLLGPSHRVAVRGLALPASDGFASPLGEVPLDRDAAQAMARLPQVTISHQAHANEHSLEVHLPFLQTILGDFSLLPLTVGIATAEEVADVLELCWGGDETLIVVSSDLSHFLPYERAKELDGASVRDILNLSHDINHDQACGATPINGLLLSARKHGLTPHLLDSRNSGDTAGPRDSVVGYASFAFTEAGVQS